MYKLFIIRLILVFFPFAAMSQETKIQLTEKVSISFPEKPTVRDMQGISIQHTVRLADSTANFYAVAINLEKSNGMSASMLETAQQDPSFWEQAEKSFVAQLGSDAEVSFSEVKEIGEKQILHLVVSATRNGKKSEMTVYVFVEGVHTINIVHQKRSQDALVELKNKYFGSLQINK